MALSGPRDTLIIAKPSLKGYKLAASTTIWKGGMVALNTDGFLVPAADAAAQKYVVGVAEETMVSGSGENPMVRVRSGEIYDFAASNTITQAMVGDDMYATDDESFNSTGGSNAVPAGVLVEFISASRGKIYIDTPNLSAHTLAHSH